MFVKNFAEVADTQYPCAISHGNTNIYTGNLSGVPFYLLNERVVKISFLLNNWQIEI